MLFTIIEHLIVNILLYLTFKVQPDKEFGQDQPNASR